MMLMTRQQGVLKETFEGHVLQLILEGGLLQRTFAAGMVHLVPEGVMRRTLGGP